MEDKIYLMENGQAAKGPFEDDSGSYYLYGRKSDLECDGVHEKETFGEVTTNQTFFGFVIGSMLHNFLKFFSNIRNRKRN